MYEEESIKEIKQLYQEERGFLQVEEDVSDEERPHLFKNFERKEKDSEVFQE